MENSFVLFFWCCWTGRILIPLDAVRQIINSIWPHSIRPSFVGIVRNFLKDAFIRVIGAKCARFPCTKDAFRQLGDANRVQSVWRRRFVIANCRSFIGLLDPCHATPHRQNWKIEKLARICCACDPKAHLAQTKQCMRSVWSKWNYNADVFPFLFPPETALNHFVYIISIRTDEHTIKHMKINQKHEKNNTLFYLSSRRLFKTIIELVSFYERNDLGENFAG